MPTIVHHYDKKTGKTRVYESTPHYDPATKQSRPKRKYLGTLDPDTGKLIPSSGRRGRTASAKNDTIMENNAPSARIADLKRVVSNKEDEIASLKSEIKTLKSTVRSYEKMYRSISNALAEVPDNL